MKRPRIITTLSSDQKGYAPVTYPKTNTCYALADQPFTRRYILKSWDDTGTCRMETTNGKEFFSHLLKLRIPAAT
jgi:hypothetical protein